MTRKIDGVRNWLHQWPTLVAWLPLLSLVFTALVAGVLYKGVVVCSDPGWTCAAHTPGVEALDMVDDSKVHAPLSELGMRSAWALSVLLYTLAIVLALSVAGWAVWSTFRERPLVLLVSVGMLGLAAIGLFDALPMGDPFVLQAAVLDPTVYAVSVAGDVVHWMEVAAAIGYAAMATAVTGAIDLSFRLARAPGDHEERAIQFAGYQRMVHTLLVVSAISLAAGSLEASMLYGWAGTMISPVPVPEGSESAVAYFEGRDALARTMGPLIGTFYTILLAAVFVPALVLMRTAARSLGRSALGAGTHPPTIEKWLEERAIGASVNRKIASTVAVFAPLLAGGPLPAVLQAIAG